MYTIGIITYWTNYVFKQTHECLFEVGRQVYVILHANLDISVWMIFIQRHREVNLRKLKEITTQLCAILIYNGSIFSDNLSR